ncbi:MAG: polysaccharide biosynthesis tyrosine autokinase [Planctomycetes bacterium]|nr:polysaccharide biosynthesis tyrosine autokinase [Planctomycetota bacterium]
MNDPRDEPVVRTLVRVCYRRRLPVLLVLVAVVALGLAGWGLREREYAASFEFRYLDVTPVERLRNLVAQGVVTAGEGVDEQALILRSSRVVKQALAVSEVVGAGMAPEEVEARVAEWQGRIRVARDGRVFAVAVNHLDGAQALRVATALMRAYQAHELDEKRQADRDQQAFIVKQLAQVQAEMAAHKATLDLFVDRDALASSRREVSSAAQVLVDRFEEALDALRHELDRLRALYQEAHPEVRSTRARLDALEAIASESDPGAVATRRTEARTPEEVAWCQDRAALLDLRLTGGLLDGELAAFDLRMQVERGLKGDKAWYQRELALAEEQYGVLRRRLAQIELAMAGVESNVEILREPDVPRLLSGRGFWEVLWLLLVLGATLGVGAGYLLEHLDTTLETREDVESLTGLKVLAQIPRLAPPPDRPRPAGALAESPVLCDVRGLTHSADAFRILLTGLRNRLGERPHVAVLVTSPGPREGKTTTTSNLALTAAEMGLVTLALSCDLRRPGIGAAFGLGEAPGVSEILAGQSAWREALRAGPVPRLTLLGEGRSTMDSSALISGPAMSQLLAETRAEFDLVLIDSPPAEMVTDALLLAPKVDGVLLVYGAGVTDKQAMRQSTGMLADCGATLLGVVMNHKESGYPGRRYGYGYYGYGYGYGQRRGGPAAGPDAPAPIEGAPPGVEPPRG